MSPLLAAAALGMQTAPPPNIVLILADDLGIGEIGAYGQQKIRTPNIDRLAAEGVRFTRFYAASPVCAPTRASLLTGKHQGRAAIRGNSEVGGWGLNEGEGQLPLPRSETTLATLLGRQGYATACVGKWGLGGPGSEGHPLNHGFDFFFGYLCQRQAHNYYPTHLWRNHDVFILEKNRYFAAHQKVEAPPASFAEWKGSQYSPDLLDDQALLWVSSQPGSPFFLYFAPTLPHVALQAPDDLVDAYPREWDAEPYLGQNGYLPCERPRATYAAMISHLDRFVGKLRDRLEKSGRLQNTVVVFTSDNGTAPNGGVDRDFFNSLGGLRGYKTQLWEGGVRVPMIVWRPGRFAPGIVDEPCQSSDVLPTVLALAGAPRPRGVTGLDMSPLLTGAAKRLDRDHLYFEFRESPSQAVLMDRRWKAIRPRLAKSLDFELYDLSNDPGEKENVASAHPDLVSRAQKLCRSERVPNRLFPLPGIDPLRP